MKNTKSVRYIGRSLLPSGRLSGSARINIAEGSGAGEEPGVAEAGEAVEAEEEEGDEVDLRCEFCARVLITTQLAEGKWTLGCV